MNVRQNPDRRKELFDQFSQRCRALESKNNADKKRALEAVISKYRLDNAESFLREKLTSGDSVKARCRRAYLPAVFLSAARKDMFCTA